MFKFLYRFSFFRYADSIATFQPVTDRKSLLTEIAAVLFFTWVFQLGISSAGIDLGRVGAFTMLYALAIFNLFCVYNMSTSIKLSALQPLTVKRKILYDFLIPIWVGFVFFVVMAVIAMIVYAIMLIVVAVMGSTISSSESTGEAIGFYGGTAYACFCIIAYCSSMRLNFLAHTKQKIRYTFSAIGCIALLIAVSTIPANIAGINSEVFGNECYTATNIPWLFAVLWVVAAAAFLGLLVRGVILYYRKQREL